MVDPRDVVVDAHVHVFDRGFMPEGLNDGAARQWAGKRPGRRPADIRARLDDDGFDPDGAEMVRILDGTGVDHAVIMMLDAGVALEEPELPHEEIAKRYAKIVADSAGRLSAFYGVDPRRPGATESFRRAVGEQGFVGLKLYPPHGYHPYEDEPMALCAVAAELGVPVLFHSGYVQPPQQSYFSNPLFLEPVQSAFPDLDVIIGHAGFDLWAREAARVVEGHDRTYLEFSQWDRVGRTDPERLARVFVEWLRICGAHRLLFGSDQVSGPGRIRSRTGWWSDFLDRLPDVVAGHGLVVTPEDVRRIKGGNAARLLGLDRLS